MPEQRHRFRAPTDRKVRWRPRTHVDEWREATLIDISTGGARLRSTAAPIHHFLALALQLGDGATLLVDCELVRIEAQLESGEFSWAVALRGLQPDAQARLTRFVFAEAQRFRHSGGRAAAVPGARALGDGGALER